MRKMKIAVLLGGVGYDSQKRIINGILDSALPDGTEVYIFTSEGWNYGSRLKHEKGEYNIYNLPDFSCFDGVIVHPDTIHDLDTVNYCIEKIKEAGIPCVSMNTKWDGAVCVNLENRVGVHAIVEHLIQVHGVRSIYYISGPSDNQDAGDRLQTYKDIMDEYHLGWKEEYIYHGDYTYQSGEQAIEYFLHMDRPMPDAIMAANDRMAIGAVRALFEAGYLVPEDVIVTGYDDSEMAALNHPRMTTVRRGEYTAGEMAYKKLRQIWNKEEPVEDDIVYGKPVFSESCGCERRNFYTHAELQELYVKRQLEVNQTHRLIKSSAAEFTAVENFEDLLVTLEKYIRIINPEYFYLCTNGSKEQYYEKLEKKAAGQEEEIDTSAYMDDIWVFFAYEKGVVRQYEGFDKRLIMPPGCQKGTGTNFYVVLPLHHQDYCFGYCVIGNYRPMIDRQLLQHFILNLCNAMESVQRQDFLREMLKRLSHIWRYDDLTGVYNRAGFHNLVDEVLKEAEDNGKSIAILFADVDGLKKVNDRLGHEEGDAFIKAMADVLLQNRVEGDLFARYGGDEFIILTTGHTEEEIRAYRDRLQKAISHYNEMHSNKWSLEASIGYHYEQNAANVNLDKIIHLADQDMYKVKRDKKRG